MPKDYQLKPERIKELGIIFLLERMVNGPRAFSVLLEGNDAHLEDLLSLLLARSYVQIDAGNRYVPTREGRKVVVTFKERYQDFLKNFDCYCAVDLEEGIFAFEEFWEYEDEDEWCAYLDGERWEDLRVAVAEHKGLDPIEILFMGFINEGRIDDKKEGWQFDLVLGSVWDELVQIASSLLQVDDLAYEDEDGKQITGEAAINDIICQGAELNLRLLAQEREMMEDDDDNDEDRSYYAGQPRVVPEVQPPEITTTVYESYRDPRYVHPSWRRRYWDWDWD
jgi:hypothetical protein